MKQLLDAARACGLRLEGILWKVDKAGSLDRPMLVYLKQGEHGHFIVVRPVGRMGKMVQVLDNDQDVLVTDLTDLTSAVEWAGLSLRPIHVDWPGRFGVVSAIIASCLCLALIRKMRKIVSR